MSASFEHQHQQHQQHQPGGYQNDRPGKFDNYRSNSDGNRTNSSEGTEFSTDAARNLHNRINEERNRLNEKKASLRHQKSNNNSSNNGSSNRSNYSTSRREGAPSPMSSQADDIDRRKSHEPDDGLESLPSRASSHRLPSYDHQNNSRDSRDSRNSRDRGFIDDYKGYEGGAGGAGYDDYDNQYNQTQVEEDLSQDHPDYYASPNAIDEDQDWYDPYGSMGESGAAHDNDLMQVKETEASRKEFYTRCLVGCYFSLAIFTIVAIVLALLGNQNNSKNRPVLCQDLTNVITQCSCQESLTMQLSDAMEANRKSIVSGLKQNSVLDSEYYEPSTSCEARNQAILFVSDPANYPGGSIGRDAQVIQRYVLALFYLKSNGESWSTNKNWLSSNSVCLWSGIECLTSSDTITGIQMNSNLLVGNITSELGSLTSLRTINLSENGNLAGHIPTQILNLPTLRTINLEMTSVGGTIPSEIQGLTNVEEIFFSKTAISGSIPTTFSQLQQLRVFRAKGAQLQGGIDPLVGLSSLEDLDLAENQLSQTVPTGLGELRYLYSLELFNNKLTGTIPTQLVRMSELIFADFGFNELTGEVPAIICALPSLDIFVVDCDKLDTTLCTCCSCSPGTGN